MAQRQRRTVEMCPLKLSMPAPVGVVGEGAQGPERSGRPGLPPGGGTKWRGVGGRIASRATSICGDHCSRAAARSGVRSGSSRQARQSRSCGAANRWARLRRGEILKLHPLPDRQHRASVRGLSRDTQGCGRVSKRIPFSLWLPSGRRLRTPTADRRCNHKNFFHSDKRLMHSEGDKVGSVGRELQVERLDTLHDVGGRVLEAPCVGRSVMAFRDPNVIGTIQNAVQGDPRL